MAHVSHNILALLTSAMEGQGFNTSIEARGAGMDSVTINSPKVGLVTTTPCVTGRKKAKEKKQCRNNIQSTNR
jgi:hypothetical protein